MMPLTYENLQVTVRCIDGVTLYSCQIIDRTLFLKDAPLLEDYSTDAAPVCGSFTLPLPAADFTFMSVYQHKNWWLRPAFGSSFEEIPRRTQLLLLQEDNLYTAYVCACDGILRGDIGGCKDGLCVDLSANGCPPDSAFHEIIASCSGEDPYLCIQKCIETLCHALGKESLLRKNKTYPSRLEGFGYCTWNSFYRDVNADGILGKLKEFKDKQIPLRWMIIDDGWQDSDEKKGKLRSLDPDVPSFPEGIAPVSRIAKETYGLESVAIWHSIIGYWHGPEEGSPAAEDLKDVLIPRHGYLVPKPDETAIFRFYDSWHEDMHDHWGIDFVKIDGQGYGSMDYKGIATYEQSSGSYMKAIERSVARHFEDNLINCMGMPPENMWLRDHSSLARSSDDFFPDEPHWFREHALQNGYNSLLQGQFYWGDWDMFYSIHEDAKQNSVLRSISGGPVYVSDQPGKTDPSILFPLMDAKGTVLRCDGIGLPTRGSLTKDPLKQKGLFKLFNTSGNHKVIAVFNIHESETMQTDTLTTAEVPGLRGKTWIVYSHFGNQLGLLEDSAPLSLSLPANDSEFLILMEKKRGWQIIGDPEKYLSTRSILSEESEAAIPVETKAVLKPSRSVIFTGDAAADDPLPVVMVDGILCDVRRNGNLFEATIPETVYTTANGNGRMHMSIR